MWGTLKEYIPLAVYWDCDGDRNYDDEIIPFLTPECLFLEAGGKYVVDRVRRDGIRPSFASGGFGIRYTVRTHCELEENYNKVFYLYYEDFGRPGRWRYEDRYVAVDVVWDADGSITPTSIYLDEYHYDIGSHGVLQAYRMSTRKTDGSGMKYIVRASCRELEDYNREFELMLENGGKMAGRWYCEDADAVHRRKVTFNELADGAFDDKMVEESMGVGHMCARFQTTIDLTDFLREWNSKSRDGIWLPPEVFERKIKEGIIYPTYYYPVMVADDDSKIVPAVMQWGLRRNWSKRPIHNLTWEKLAVKDTFANIKGNRCVVPCGGYYEYAKQGDKVVGDYLFHNPGHGKMYLAGLYEPTESGGQYSIITTSANASVGIHDRMPVVLRRDECKAWLHGQLDFEKAGDRKNIMLDKEAV